MKNIFLINVLLGLSLTIAFPVIGHSAALNAFSRMAPRGNLGITWSLRGDMISDNDWAGTAVWDFNLVYGISDKLSLKVAKSGWGIIRWDFLGKSRGIAALMVSDSFIAPQFHSVLSKGRLGLEINLASYFFYDNPGNPTIKAVIAPNFKLSDNWYAYLELNPAYSFDSEQIDFALTPGLCAKLGEGWVSAGVKFSSLLDEKLDAQYGMWYWIGFDLMKD